MAFSRRGSAEINVTPLIDVVMCLIIFFMLVAKIGVDTGADQRISIPASLQPVAARGGLDAPAVRQLGARLELGKNDRLVAHRWSDDVVAVLNQHGYQLVEPVSIENLRHILTVSRPAIARQGLKTRVFERSLAGDVGPMLAHVPEPGSGHARCGVGRDLAVVLNRQHLGSNCGRRRSVVPRPAVDHSFPPEVPALIRDTFLQPRIRLVREMGLSLASCPVRRQDSAISAKSYVR